MTTTVPASDFCNSGSSEISSNLSTNDLTTMKTYGGREQVHIR